MTTPLITSRTDWSPGLLQDIYAHIEDIALNDLKLDVYPNQIEVISAEQMIDAYASIGMPINYNHWSFGKEFLKNWQKYQKGRMGLAYEIVINSDPCISYLMEENNACTQALVMAHAAFGHNHVFKNNYMFKEWTTPSSIIDYMLFARDYIRSCEEKYGEDEVELLIDAAHALSQHGIDKRKRKHKKRLNEEEKIAKEVAKADEVQANLDIIIQTTSMEVDEPEKTEADLDLVGDEENILYFIYKNAPNMLPWQREVLRIIYKIQQYFYPQGQDKTLNEGFATHTHCYIMNELEKKGLISDDAMLQIIHMNSGVLFQPDMKSKYYRGDFNPYALGYDILKEVRRVCEDPTREDEEWFPELIGTDWRDATKDAIANYRDESFIEQFMTPKLMRDYRMMTVDYQKEAGVVTEISDDLGYRNMRRTLALQYNPINRIPEIVVHSARMKGDRTLTLEYRPHRGRSLHKGNAEKTIQHVKLLWGYPVEIVTIDDNQQKVLFRA
jgi:spore cortex formation protein SpoVR/YcgB (stage V sporulation)